MSSQCFSGQSCTDRVCSYPEKYCSPPCSLNGVCAFFVTSTGDVIDECFEGDTSCEAVCRCTGDSHTGVICSTLLSELETNRRVRVSLLSAYNSTLQYDDPISSSIGLNLQEIYELSGNSLHLSEESCNIIRVIVAWFLQRAIGFNIFHAELGVLYSTLDNCDGLRETGDFVVERRLSSSGPSAREVLVSFTDYIEKSMVLGDANVDYVLSHSRTRSSLSGALSGLQLSVPSTALELALRVEQSSVYVAAEHIILSPAGTSLDTPLLAATLEEREARGYSNSTDFISNPLQIRLSLSPDYELLPTGFVNVTLAFSRAQEFISSSNKSKIDRVVFITNCTAGNYSTHEYTCPTGETATHQCPGKEKVFTSRCPEVLFHPVCQLLVSGAFTMNSATCSRVGYTENLVHCSCPILTSLVTTSDRTTSTDALRPVGQLEVVALGVVYPEGVLFHSNDRGVGVEEVEEGEVTVVLALMGTMWALGVGCVVYLLHSFLNDVINEGGDEFKVRRSLQVLDNLSSQEAGAFLIKYINECLPEIFRSYSVKVGEKEKILAELYRCHRFSKLFLASGSKTVEARLNNGLHLLTVWATLIFFLAIFYDAQVCYLLCMYFKKLYSVVSSTFVCVL